MTTITEKTLRIPDRSEHSLSQAKDEEYAYWQSGPPLGRLLADRSNIESLYQALLRFGAPSENL